MNLEIKKLTLKNYARFPSFEVDFTRKTIISGKNGLGKTTLANAIFNVLFMGKNMDGSKADRHRPHDSNGNELNKEPVIATLVIAIDGKEHTITRSECQKWVKHRGRLEAEFEGNTTNYLVDDVPMQESQYKRWLDNLGINEKEFRTVTTAKDLLNMKVNDRRNALVKMFGDIDNDYDLAAQNEKYADLVKLLEVSNIDEVVNNYKQEFKKCESVMQDVPSRIKERQEMLIDIDEEQLNQEKARIEKAIEENKAAKQVALGDSIGNYKLQLINLDAEISNREMALQKEYGVAYSNLHKQLTVAQINMDNLLREKEKCKETYDTLKVRINEHKLELEKIKTEYKEVSSNTFNSEAAVCPYCGKSLDEEHLVKAKKSFEDNKQKEMSTLSNRGNIIYEGILADQTEYSKLIDKAKRVKSEIDKQEETIKQITDALSELGTINNKLDSDNTLNKLKEAKNVVEGRIASLSEKQPDLSEYDRNIDALTNELNEVKFKLKQVAYNNQNKQMIAEYEQKLIDTRKKGADIQRILDLAEDFKRDKIKKVTDKINSSFSIVKWIMFENLINGGISDVCIPTVNGSILGNELNTGMSILAEIDICNAFQKKLDLKAPIIIDNAEQLDSFSINGIKSDTQLIMFRVTDDELKIDRGEDY
jgi:DNA repair exonuclease SbcCD ATPase subunit